MIILVNLHGSRFSNCLTAFQMHKENSNHLEISKKKKPKKQKHSRQDTDQEQTLSPDRRTEVLFSCYQVSRPIQKTCSVPHFVLSFRKHVYSYSTSHYKHTKRTTASHLLIPFSCKGLFKTKLQTQITQCTLIWNLLFNFHLDLVITKLQTRKASALTTGLKLET